MFYAPPVLTSVFPKGLFSSGNYNVTLIGRNFNAVGANDVTEASCRFFINGQYVLGTPVSKTATSLACISPDAQGTFFDSNVQLSLYQGDFFSGSPVVTLDYFPEPTLVSISPQFGTTSGNTFITISGTGLNILGLSSSDGLAKCLFRSNTTYTTSIATAITETSITCATPAWSGAFSGSSLQVEVLVSINGQDFSPSEHVSSPKRIFFTYFKEPQLTSCVPSGGPLDGGTVVTIQGSGMFNLSSLLCRFGESSDMQGFATYISTSNLTCETTESVYSTVNAATVNIFISFNGQNFVNSGLKFTFYPPLTVTGLAVAGGPTSGNTQVAVEGSGFSAIANTNTSVCMFGDTISAVIKVTDSYITCLSPATSSEVSVDVLLAVNGQDFQSVSTGYSYYKQPNITKLEPPGVPCGFNSAVKVVGTNFQALGSNAVPECMLVCSNGVAYLESADVLSDSVMQCSSPVLSVPTSCNLSVSINGLDFTNHLELAFFRQPSIYSVSPMAGLSTYSATENSIAVTGHGFDALGTSSNSVAQCRFGSASTTATVVSNVLVSCEWPQTDSGTLDVAVAINGIDYSTASTTVSFILYDPPVFSSALPQGAPFGISGTIKITGSNFLTFGTLDTTSCQIGTTTIGASRRTNTQIDCPFPASLGSDSESLEVTVSVFGTDHVSAFPDAVTFSRYAIPHFSNISKTSGTPVGGDTVVISGSGMLGTAGASAVKCRFGTFEVSADSATSTTVTCTTPAMTGGIFEVDVSLNLGVSWGSNSTIVPSFYSQCELLSGSLETCVKGGQCGMCSDNVNISNTLSVHFTGDTSHHVTWDAQSGMTRFQVQRLDLNNIAVRTFETEELVPGVGSVAQRGSGNLPYNSVSTYAVLNASLPTNTSSYLDSSVVPGGKYRYRISGRVSNSDPWIQLREYVVVLIKQYSLSWSSVARAGRYLIMRTESSNSSLPTQTLLAEVSSTSYVDTAVIVGRSYSYHVIAEVTECQLCSHLGCPFGSSSGTCHKWSSLEALENPAALGDAISFNATVAAGQTHYYQITPPLSGVRLRVRVDSNANTLVYASKNSVPVPSTALASSRISSPLEIVLKESLVTCSGKVLTTGWFESEVGAYEPSGCDKWTFAVRNNAFSVGTMLQNIWGNELVVTEASSQYQFQFNYDELVFKSFACEDSDADCSAFGLLPLGAASFTTQFGSRVLRLTTSSVESESSTPQVGGLVYKSPLPIAKGFDSYFRFRISKPSTCLAPREVLVFARTEDSRKTNFIIDAMNGTLPPETSQNEVLSLDITTNNGVEYSKLPVSGVTLPLTSLDLLSSECSEDGYGRIGGDGFAFVIRSAATNISALGCNQEGVGYKSNANCTSEIQDFLALQFDAYSNVTMTRSTFTSLEPPAEQNRTKLTFFQHSIVSLFATNTSLPLAQTATSQHHQIEIDDSELHEVHVSYIPPHGAINGTFAVYLDSQLLFNVPMDLSVYLDSLGNGYLGFTASTNDLASENHDIVAWSVCLSQCDSNPIND
eukprot:c6656_g1_i1.p1 GENE.c6656_g1_i1~~c6656_g1_i1.p1  ORF type:complete len:1508 (+),score=361.23 c6656_g1_i1:20-4543(+)